MLKIKNIAIRNSSVMLKDENSLELLRGALAKLFDIDRSQITMTHQELNGRLNENDPCLYTMLNLSKQLSDDE